MQQQQTYKQYKANTRRYLWIAPPIALIGGFVFSAHDFSIEYYILNTAFMGVMLIIFWFLILKPTFYKSDFEYDVTKQLWQLFDRHREAAILVGKYFPEDNDISKKQLIAHEEFLKNRLSMIAQFAQKKADQKSATKLISALTNGDISASTAVFKILLPPPNA